MDAFKSRGIARRPRFNAGDAMQIVVTCKCNVDTENLNVAFRILNKEGVKVTTWGTLNEDMPNFSEHIDKTLWNKRFLTGDTLKVSFTGICSLGANLYEIQATVAREHDQYYGNQQILHWMDEAAHVTIILKNKEYVFDGVCDLGFRSTLQVSPAGQHDGAVPVVQTT